MYFFLTPFIIVLFLFGTDYFVFKLSYFSRETSFSYFHIWKRGCRFEYRVFNRLKHKLGYQYPILYNLLIQKRGSKNEFTEIDLLLFHATGIYAIEVKDYHGKIYGSENDQKWELINHWHDKHQKLHTYRRAFYNPLKQNGGHIYHLKHLAHYNYYNIILFSDQAMLQNEAKNVMHVGEFVKQIKKIPHLPNGEYEQILNIYRKLKACNRYSTVNMKNHIKYLNEKMRDYSDSIPLNR